MRALKASARAHPNIALVKYWGKRDERRILPWQSSLSVTLAPLAVQTEVAFGAKGDRVVINGKPAHGEARARVLRVVDQVRVRSMGGVTVRSQGDFPSGAGLASSAAAFAALAAAARRAAGLPEDPAATSRLARLGSGSACRSVQGGFCVWRRGRRADGRDSFAEQLFDERHWPGLRLVAALVDEGEKAVGSRDGMRRTVATSPFYRAWTADAEAEVGRARRFIARRDLEGLGELSERNAWRMHATALAAAPALCYLLPGTLRILNAVALARRRGLPVWFTLDAGPNPVLLTDRAHAGAVTQLAVRSGATRTVLCRPGPDVAVDST